MFHVYQEIIFSGTVANKPLEADELLSPFLSLSFFPSLSFS